MTPVSCHGLAPLSAFSLRPSVVVGTVRRTSGSAANLLTRIYLRALKGQGSALAFSSAIWQSELLQQNENCVLTVCEFGAAGSKQTGGGEEEEGGGEEDGEQLYTRVWPGGTIEWSRKTELILIGEKVGLFANLFTLHRFSCLCLCCVIFPTRMRNWSWQLCYSFGLVNSGCRKVL